MKRAENFLVIKLNKGLTANSNVSRPSKGLNSYLDERCVRLTDLMQDLKGIVSRDWGQLSVMPAQVLEDPRYIFISFSSTESFIVFPVKILF